MAKIVQSEDYLELDFLNYSLKKHNKHLHAVSDSPTLTYIYLQQTSWWIADIWLPLITIAKIYKHTDNTYTMKLFDKKYLEYFASIFGDNYTIVTNILHPDKE